MKVTKQLSELKYKQLDERNIELLEPLKVQVGQLIIIVPAGFVSDGASTPKVLWVFFPPWDKRYAVATIIHDYLYSELNITGLNKELSDEIFIKIMEENGVGIVKRRLMYRAVSMFGSIFFKPKVKFEGYKQKALVDHTKEAKAYYKFWEKILGFK